MMSQLSFEDFYAKALHKVSQYRGIPQADLAKAITKTYDTHDVVFGIWHESGMNNIE